MILIEISDISLQGSMEQSLEFREALAGSPMAKECEREMSEGNSVLSFCRNVTEAASQLDQHNLKLKYSNIPTSWLGRTYRAYSVIRHLAYPYVSENIFPPEPKENQVEINLKLNSNNSALNVSIESPLMNVNITNIRLNPLAASLLQINPKTSVLDRIGKRSSPVYFERKFNFILVNHLC